MSRIRHLIAIALLALALAPSSAWPAKRAATEIDAQRDGAATARTPLIAVICYHDISDSTAAPTYTLPPDSLRAHIRRAKANGWTFLPLSKVLAKREHPGKLPPKVMVLTFDDGYRSFLERALPILLEEKVLATLTIITSFVDNPPPGLPPLLSWEEIRRLDRSDDVEIASHTHDLHCYVTANPYWDTAPAVTARQYFLGEERYETRDEYEARLVTDLGESRRRLRDALGHDVSVLAWPYGELNARAQRIAANEGFRVTLGLEGEPVDATSLAMGYLPRVMAYRETAIGDSDLGWLYPPQRPVRSARIDIDDIYSPDITTLRENIDETLHALRLVGATDVIIQGLADPVGDGFLREAFFMNHQVPLSADVWSMVAHRVTREGMKPWIRVPSLNLTWEWERHPEWRVPFRVDRAGVSAAPWYFRVSPDLPEARAAAVDFYTDLAVYLPVRGVVFDDDAYLRADEALVGSGARDPAVKRDAIRGYLNEVKAAVRSWRPRCRFGRILYPAVSESAGVHPQYAQDLVESLREEDVTIVTTPASEAAAARDPRAWGEAFARRALAIAEEASAASLLLDVETRAASRDSSLSVDVLEAVMSGLRAGGAINVGISRVVPNASDLPANLLRPPDGEGETLPPTSAHR